MRQLHLLAATFILGAATLFTTSGCTSTVSEGTGGNAGAGGNDPNTTTSSNVAPTVSSGPGTYGENCPKPTGFLLSVTLNDGSSLPSDATAPSSTTTIDGTVHLLAQGGYTVTSSTGEVVTIGEDATTTTFAGVTEGMTATLYVGYIAAIPSSTQYSLQVELTNTLGDLVYFAVVGLGDTPPGARVGVAFGKESCAKGVSSGTGSITQLIYDLDVTIDGAPLGTFPMGTPMVEMLGSKSYEVDNHASLQDYFSTTMAAISVLGRQSP